MTVEPNPAKMDLLVESTLEVCARRFVNVDWIETITSLWTWFALIIRCALSTLDVTYKFIVKHRGGERTELWLGVKEELMTLVALRPLFFADLGRPWCPQALMTDASFWGGGALETTATTEELRTEARLTAPKGWFMELELLDDQLDPQGDLSCDEFDELEMDPTMPTHAENLGPMPAVLRVIYVAHLFSGMRRTGDFEDYLTQLGREHGAVVIVASIDLAISDDYDLKVEEKREAILDQARSGHWRGCLAGPPCGTFSRARYNYDLPGPPRLRRRDRIRGLA
jgi:hypothetical protein